MDTHASAAQGTADILRDKWSVLSGRSWRMKCKKKKNLPSTDEIYEPGLEIRQNTVGYAKE